MTITLATALKITQQFILVRPFVNSVSGKSKLSAADLGLRPEDVPPADLATLGSFSVIPKDALTPFESARGALHSAFLKRGTRLFGAYLVPKSLFLDCAKEADEIVTSVYDYKPKFIASRHSIVENWCNQPGHVKFKDRILAKVRSDSYFENRIQAGYETLPISPPEVPAGSAPDSPWVKASDRFLNDLSRAMDGVLSEIAQDALTVWNGSLHKDVPVNARPEDMHLYRKDKVSQKILSPIRKMAQKAQDLVVLDPRLGSVAAWIESRLSMLPREGYMSGADLEHITKTISTLMDPQAVLSVVASATADAKVLPDAAQRDLVPQTHELFVSESSNPQPTADQAQTDAVSSQESTSDAPEMQQARDVLSSIASSGPSAVSQHAAATLAVVAHAAVNDDVVIDDL